MKTILLAALMWASIVSATAPTPAWNLSSLLDALPKCSMECIVQAVTDDGCGLVDLKCQCTKLTSLTKTVSPCLVKAGCDLDQMTFTATSIVQLCESKGNAIQNTTSPIPGAMTHYGAGTPMHDVKWAGVLALLMATLML